MSPQPEHPDDSRNCDNVSSLETPDNSQISNEDQELPGVGDLSLEYAEAQPLYKAENTTKIPRYAYRPLASREIRLIRILPGQDDVEEIEGNIITANLDDCLPFVAVSYVWAYDDSQMKRFVERWNVDMLKPEDPHLETPKGSIPISASLRAALNSVRSVRRKIPMDLQKPYKHPLYWADAVCINQSDNDEKGRQVQMMSEIYSKAELVHVHLGAVAVNSSLAIRTFLAMRDISTMDDKQAAWFFEPESTAAIAVRDFLERPWFTRIWTVQEILASRTALMVCGTESILWDDLTRFSEVVALQLYGGLIEGIGSYAQGPEYHVKRNKLTKFSLQDAKYLFQPIQEERGFINGFGNVAILAALYQKRKKYPPGSDPRPLENCLFYMLWCFAPWEASFDIDHLFALISLCEEQSDSRLRPDYEASLETVLSRYGEFFVDDGKTLDMLYTAGITWGSKTRGPSWVPNWAGTKKDGLIGQREVKADAWSSSLGLSKAAQNGLYFAGGEHTLQARSPPESGELWLRGCCIDVIKDVDPSTQSGPFHMVDVISQGLNLQSLLDNYPTGEAVIDAVWRTLVGNSYEDGWEVSDDFYSQLQTILPLVSDELSLQIGLHSSMPFVERLEQMGSNRKGCLTEGGYIGMVPNVAQPGDRICIVYGSPVPFTLRPVEGEQAVYHLVGECYVHGLMKGEAFGAQFPLGPLSNDFNGMICLR